MLGVEVCREPQKGQNPFPTPSALLTVLLSRAAVKLSATLLAEPGGPLRGGRMPPKRKRKDPPLRSLCRLSLGPVKESWPRAPPLRKLFTCPTHQVMA